MSAVSAYGDVVARLSCFRQSATFLAQALRPALGAAALFCLGSAALIGSALATPTTDAVIIGQTQATGVQVDNSAIEKASFEPSGIEKADRVLVVKSERRLYLLKDGEPIKSYRVALGRRPVGHKVTEGDGRTPEGIYVLDWRNPRSQFYRSLHISYPDASDIAFAQRRGRAPGANIMIHGLSRDFEILGPHHVRFNWTQGCIAVTNEEIDEIWAAVDDGTLIEIRP
jgi:murein L,D-transpeptidase YafK